MKKQLIITLMLAATGLTVALGAHFGMSSNSKNNYINTPNTNTNAIRNLRNVSGNVSYEFDVLDFAATNTSQVKIGIQALDNSNNVSKDYGNFQLKNYDSYSFSNHNYSLSSSQYNSQQVIKLDNLSSAGVTIKVSDIDNSNQATKYVNLSVSVKNATAYDPTNNAYYVGIVSAKSHNNQVVFNYNANTSDIAQTIHILETVKSKGAKQGLLKVQAINPTNNMQNPSKDDWSSNHFSDRGTSKGYERLSTLTYQTPESFALLRTVGVQYDLDRLNFQLYYYCFVASKKQILNDSYYFDHAKSANPDKNSPDSKDKYNESRSVSQVVDMTTLAGATKTTSFFNGRMLVISDSITSGMKLAEQAIYSNTVLFNSN